MYRRSVFYLHVLYVCITPPPPGKSGGETSKKAETMEHKITDKLFSHTRYFVMKSNNYDNIDIAKSKVK